MSTSTARSLGALPATPVTVTGDSTVERSPMVTPVVFSKRSPVGGGVVSPSPTYSRRLGEPLPGLPTTPEVAAEVRAEETWAGVGEGLSARGKAAAAATCGLALDVPEMVLGAEVPLFPAEVMAVPGANTPSTETELEVAESPLFQAEVMAEPGANTSSTEP